MTSLQPGDIGLECFILGAQFSAADVMLGATLIWAGAMGLLAEHPELAKYCERLQERPAYARHVMVPFGELYGRLDY